MFWLCFLKTVCFKVARDAPRDLVKHHLSFGSKRKESNQALIKTNPGDAAIRDNVDDKGKDEADQ
jgi:hypothetical protein